VLSIGGRVAGLVLLATVVILVPGWHAGYRSAAPYVSFWILNTLALLDAVIVVQRFFPFDTAYDQLVKVGVAAVAIVVLCGLLLGAIGALTPVGYLVALSLLLAGIAVLPSRPAQASGEIDPQSQSIFGIRPAILVALVVPVAIFVAVLGVMHPPVEYDSLTYHLFFPARWLQDHRISILQTPFGEQAPAYAPSNAELFFLWLMIPFHGDLLARAGQFPFYCLTALSLYAIARKWGSTPGDALYAPALYLVARPIVEQVVGADIDLAFAATFVAATYLALVAYETRRRSDLVLCGVALGLWFGTKYIALAYGPLLLALVVVEGFRAESAWILPGIAVWALPWYIRNWVVAGSPIYPSSLAVGRFTIAPGAFGAAALKNSGWQHLSDVALLPPIVQQAFGADLLTIAAVPFALGAWCLAKNRQWLRLAVTLAMPVALIGVFWYGIPFNNSLSARYMFPAVALALLLVPSALQLGGVTRTLLRIALVGGVVWLAVFSTDALVSQSYLHYYAAIAVVTALGWALLRGRPALQLGLLGAIVAATFGYSVSRCSTDGCEWLNLSQFTRPTMFDGWTWVDQHATNSTIAYTGNNIPYRLLGPTFDRRVYYVNIDRHFEWLYHNYDRAERRQDNFKPPDVPNPPYPRLRGFRDAWVANLKRAGVDYLFISRLAPLLMDDNWHNDEGFPVEEDWAKADPKMFSLVYANPEVKIYAVTH
jgi:hypothetical protein